MSEDKSYSESQFEGASNDRTSSHDDYPYSHTSLGDNKKRRRIRRYLVDKPLSHSFPMPVKTENTESTLSMGESGDGGQTGQVG